MKAHLDSESRASAAVPGRAIQTSRSMNRTLTQGRKKLRAPEGSINAASFDERSYSNRSPRLWAPPPTPTYVESSYAPRSSYSYDSQPPSCVSEWQQFPEYPHHAAAFSVPRERLVCYQCGVRGHIARFCPSRRRPRTTFSDRPAMLPRRNQQPDYTYWPSDSSAQKHGYRPNIRSDSPASVGSLTPPTTRQRRSPSVSIYL
ncbi:hypothetical protein HPB52_006172 [Rhipicephalus sanguineus]|uniref:CCHC-type domain-containing protein n=1 Tax=Rhipicephalus sanguineus TaxID=34632 RepID=A0A9D4QLB1_RHISA|nr:hypothetical protein HPB52_006172 [Rhipicephalus sanguineus]